MTEKKEVASLKTCESCGEEFGCGAGSETCWCFDVKTSPQVLEKLSTTYGDCLCPKCLEANPTPADD